MLKKYIKISLQLSLNCGNQTTKVYDCLNKQNVIGISNEILLVQLDSHPYSY